MSKYLICLIGRKMFLWVGFHETDSMCESSNPQKYFRRKVSLIDDSTDEEEAFTKLSAQTISKLIEEEPDVYSIEDAKVRYK